MTKIHSWIYLFPKIWETLFETPITGRYPFEPLHLPTGFRGKVVMQADLCVGCGLCVRDCPSFALKIDRFGKQQFRITYDPLCCAYCGQCEISCHRGAIQLTNEFHPATSHYQNLLKILVERNLPENQENTSS